MFDVNGRSVLITGGSRGLGRALAIGLAERGARVVLVARNELELKETVTMITNRRGVAFGISADVGDKQSIYPIAGEAAALAGPVDVLINNASTLGAVPLRLVADTECEDFARVLEVNTLGPFRLIKATTGSMLLKRAGVVMNISSDAAIEAYAGWGAYSSSKAALDHLTRITALEFEGSGVCFLSVDPGEMDTRMHAEAMPDAETDLLAKPDVVAEKIISMIQNSDQLMSGARLTAADWKVPQC